MPVLSPRRKSVVNRPSSPALLVSPRPTVAWLVAAAVALVAVGLCALLGCQWRLVLFFAVCLPCAWLIWAFRSRLEQRPAEVFLALALPVGLLMCAFMPSIVSVSWDGYVHYKASNRLAQRTEYVETDADLINYDMEGIYTVGLIPWGTSWNDWDPNWKAVLSEEGMEHANATFEAASGSVANEGTASASWDALTLCRLPNTLGLWLGSALGLSYLRRLLLGRIVNLVVYVLVMYGAIRSLRSGQRIMCAFALTPTLLFLACNYSYDPLCIGLIAFGTCHFLRELQTPKETLTWGNALLVLVPLLLGLAVKAPLVPLALFLVFLPKEKFRTRWGHGLWLAACWACAALIVLSFVMPFLSSGGAGYADTRGEDLNSATATNINAGQQLVYAAQHPLGTLGAIAVALLGLVNPVEVFYQIPVNYCYLPLPIAWPVLDVLYWLMVVGTCLWDRTTCDDGWPSARLRIGAVAGMVLGYGLIAFALYLSYNNVGSGTIIGLQVRYLLLAMPCVLLLVANLGTKPRAWAEKRIQSAPASRDAKLLSAAQSPAVWLGVQSLLVWGALILGFVLRF